MKPTDDNGQLAMPDGTTFAVIESASSSEGARIVFEITMAPGATGPPRHFHPAQEESWSVQEGELSVQVNNEWHTLTAGESLTIPPDRTHSQEPVRSDGPLPGHPHASPRLPGLHQESRPAHQSRKAEQPDDATHTDLRRDRPHQPPPPATHRQPRSAHRRVPARDDRALTWLPHPP